MESKAGAILSFIIGVLISIAIIIFGIIISDEVTISYKDIINSGCGYYNSDEELFNDVINIIKDKDYIPILNYDNLTKQKG